ncbi:MAG: hypothetical protein IKX60_08960 [Bacteroidales bacterium]|nr:hypothetical protein [Bacteroidales bacterium]
MKRPVVIPATSPEQVNLNSGATTLEESLLAYASILLASNEPCLEASESALAVACTLCRLDSRISIILVGNTDTILLYRGGQPFYLRKKQDGSVRLSFSYDGDELDISDYGPDTVSAFIVALFDYCDKATMPFWRSPKQHYLFAS